MIESKTVSIVIGGSIIVAAYWRPEQADIHARTVTGAQVKTLEILDRVPDSVLEDMETDYDDGGDTPVIGVEVLPKPR